MPITDSVSNVYMNNMYVTGGNANNNYASGVSQTPSLTNLGNALPTANNSNNLTNSFSQMLSGMMAGNTANMASGIGDFSGLGGSGDTSSALSGLMGMGSGSSMDSMSGSSESNIMMMMVLLLLAQQNNNGQNNNLLNSLNGNNAATMGYNNANASAQTYANMASQGIPTNSASVANAAITSNVGQRSADLYRAVINQFNVESNQRYAVNKQGIGDTYCNIFAWDVTRAMGAEVPHYIDSATGAPVSSGAGGAKELNANQVNNWLNSTGRAFGWTKVSAEEAQYYANMGMPSITSWKNSAGHGHLQVVSPSVDGQYDPSRGVAIAQAGRQVKNYDYITSVYGASTLPHVEYFVHV